MFHDGFQLFAPTLNYTSFPHHTQATKSHLYLTMPLTHQGVEIRTGVYSKQETFSFKHGNTCGKLYDFNTAYCGNYLQLHAAFHVDSMILEC